jgi:hypothetical protein
MPAGPGSVATATQPVVGDQHAMGSQSTRRGQSAARAESASVLQPSRGDQAFAGLQQGGHTAGSAKAAERTPAESPKLQTETHIAEQRVSGGRPAPAEAPVKPTTPAAAETPVEKLAERPVEKLAEEPAEKPVKPPSRLSNYQAEAAKLLSGAMTGRRKRRAIPEIPVADPVAEDQAGQASRPAKKGQFKKD